MISFLREKILRSESARSSLLAVSLGILIGQGLLQIVHGRRKESSYSFGNVSGIEIPRSLIHLRAQEIEELLSMVKERFGEQFHALFVSHFTQGRDPLHFALDEAISRIVLYTLCRQAGVTHSHPSYIESKLADRQFIAAHLESVIPRMALKEHGIDREVLFKWLSNSGAIEDFDQAIESATFAYIARSLLKFFIPFKSFKGLPVRIEEISLPVTCVSNWVCKNYDPEGHGVRAFFERERIQSSENYTQPEIRVITVWQFAPQTYSDAPEQFTERFNADMRALLAVAQHKQDRIDEFNAKHNGVLESLEISRSSCPEAFLRAFKIPKAGGYTYSCIENTGYLIRLDEIKAEKAFAFEDVQEQATRDYYAHLTQEYLRELSDQARLSYEIEGSFDSFAQSFQERFGEPCLISVHTSSDSLPRSIMARLEKSSRPRMSLSDVSVNGGTNHCHIYAVQEVGSVTTSQESSSDHLVAALETSSEFAASGIELFRKNAKIEIYRA